MLGALHPRELFYTFLHGRMVAHPRLYQNRSQLQADQLCPFIRDFRCRFSSVTTEIYLSLKSYLYVNDKVTMEETVRTFWNIVFLSGRS
jgi:hypothetical protein